MSEDRRIPATEAEGQPLYPTEAEAGPTAGPWAWQRWLPSALAARFTVMEPLAASGGEADVYVVVDAAGTKYVAKVYRPGRGAKREVMERLSQGLPTHVVQLHERGESEGRWYEVLEYAAGGSLRGWMDRDPGPFREARVRTILEEIHGALVQVHQRQVVYRDLKPDNILIRALDPLDLVLTDFGIASVVDAEWKISDVDHGTRYYQAPESLQRVVTPAVDYWALGIMLVELLNGRHPFAGLPVLAVHHQLTTPAAVPLGKIDGAWVQLCRGLLTKAHEPRWGAAQVTRWLAGARDIPIFVDTPVEVTIKAFPFGSQEYQTPAALAAALTRDWDAALKDYGRGLLTNWLTQDVRDVELTRFVMDLDDAPGALDGKLFRLVTRLAPHLAPSYQGYALDEATLLGLAARAMGGNARAGQVLTTIYHEQMLRAHAELTGQRALGDVDAAWRTGMASWTRHRATLEQAGLPRDAVVTTPAQLLASVLAVSRSAEVTARLAAEVATTDRAVGRHVPWYRALGRASTTDPVATLLLATVAGTARATAADARQTRRAQWRPLITWCLCLAAVLVMLSGWPARRRIEPLQPASAPLLAGPQKSITVGGSEVNVRSLPSATASVITRAGKGLTLRQVSAQGDWIGVDLGPLGRRGTGWIHKSLTAVPSWSVPQAERTPADSASGSAAGVNHSPNIEGLEAILAAADAQIRDGDYDRALAEAERAVRLYPGDDRARSLIERVHRIRKILK